MPRVKTKSNPEPWVVSQPDWIPNQKPLSCGEMETLSSAAETLARKAGLPAGSVVAVTVASRVIFNSELSRRRFLVACRGRPGIQFVPDPDDTASLWLRLI